MSTAFVIGPPLAAPMLIGAGVYWALVINALSFVASFISVRMIRLDSQPDQDGSGHAARQGFWDAFGEGLRFFGTNRMLMVLAGAVCIYTLGVGALSVLDVFFVKDNLQVGASWLGIVSGGFGIGSIAGALLVAPAVKRMGEIRLFCLGLTLTGVLLLFYARMTPLPAAVVVIAIAGVPVGAVSATASPLILKVTPARLIGRVTAVLNPVMQLAGIISMALAGLLASTVLLHLRVDILGIHMQRIDVIFSFSALLMIASGLAALPRMRAADSARTTAATAAAPGAG